MVVLQTITDRRLRSQISIMHCSEPYEQDSAGKIQCGFAATNLHCVAPQARPQHHRRRDMDGGGIQPIHDDWFLSNRAMKKILTTWQSGEERKRKVKKNALSMSVLINSKSPVTCADMSRLRSGASSTRVKSGGAVFERTSRTSRLCG